MHMMSLRYVGSSQLANQQGVAQHYLQSGKWLAGKTIAAINATVTMPIESKGNALCYANSKLIKNMFWVGGGRLDCKQH